MNHKAQNEPAPASLDSIRYDSPAMDAESIRRALANRLIFTVGKDPITATPRDWLHALTYVVRDRLIEPWMETQRSYYRVDAKRIYYLSLEFLIGRALYNSLYNLRFFENCRQAMEELGLDMDSIHELESDAALGNGGLGRLAACFLDSMATIGLPGYGYGIRYEYGMFTQRLEHGYQVEHPDNWLRYGNPWELPRPEVLYPVKFYGRVVQYTDEFNRSRRHWVDAEEVMAMAYDTPIPGFGGKTVNNLRLWSAKATRDFDLKYFNEGNYISAVGDKTESENLSKVLYPDDTTAEGRELRLRQQYFFVSASLQDILFRFRKHHDSWEELPDKVAVQLNDTHPSVAIPELMRLLVDVQGLDWDPAWAITRRVFAYTNHTLLPEALETWPVELLEQLLPRHMQIIYDINYYFLKRVAHAFPGDADRLRRMSLINETGERSVRMAHLAIVGSHRVNGVARLHTDLMRATIFRDFNELEPEKIVNMTNGITPRRWLNQANPFLARLITRHIGDAWTTDLGRLEALVPLAEQLGFRDEFRAVKLGNKALLAGLIRRHLGLEVLPDSLFDVQVKRIHEYKRQLLNALHIVTLYNRIRSGQVTDPVPRTFLFAGKAAPGYQRAKQIIKFINDIAEVVNNDPAMHDVLKVVFIPNYDVSTAADIIPAADVSEQISTAGTEASGTGNMKLALNGALTVGTLDGATIEIRDAVGDDNIFIFGHTADEVEEIRRRGYRPRHHYDSDAELRQVLDMMAGGFFAPQHRDRHRPLVDELLNRDHYLLLADFGEYVRCQERVSELYRNPEEWTRRSILNVARMGRFSSDRTIGEYATQIWNVHPVRRDHARNGEPAGEPGASPAERR